MFTLPLFHRPRLICKYKTRSLIKLIKLFDSLLWELGPTGVRVRKFVAETGADVGKTFQIETVLFSQIFGFLKNFFK